MRETKETDVGLALFCVEEMSCLPSNVIMASLFFIGLPFIKCCKREVSVAVGVCVCVFKRKRRIVRRTFIAQ